jgi:hypothetical protein
MRYLVLIYDEQTGFYLIDAKDLDEALDLGGQCPGAKFGSIEVRPIVDFDAPDVISQFG